MEKGTLFVTAHKRILHDLQMQNHLCRTLNGCKSGDLGESNVKNGVVVQQYKVSEKS